MDRYGRMAPSPVFPRLPMDKHDDHYIRLFLIQACSQHKTADVAELSRGSSDDAIKHLLACMEFDDWHSWLEGDVLTKWFDEPIGLRNGFGLNLGTSSAFATGLIPFSDLLTPATSTPTATNDGVNAFTTGKLNPLLLPPHPHHHHHHPIPHHCKSPKCGAALDKDGKKEEYEKGGRA
ncbi:hypothetical protein ECG_00252 [Echinococcus granulosus]|uniref:SWIRM domain-containing protein n=1 Tax=Echinococcus granulosus TaxID=6210 RepID=A0A068WY20_ECHGR|nr:hypothetical protein ECG_00252 [Echinococcus granulosus]CDS22594.1 hypothetical protein EgrG_002032300 [Echinococcus granulosus]